MVKPAGDNPKKPEIMSLKELLTRQRHHAAQDLARAKDWLAVARADARLAREFNGLDERLVSLYLYMAGGAREHALSYLRSSREWRDLARATAADLARCEADRAEWAAVVFTAMPATSPTIFAADAPPAATISPTPAPAVAAKRPAQDSAGVASQTPAEDADRPLSAGGGNSLCPPQVCPRRARRGLAA